MHATDIDSRRNPDGSIDLRFMTDLDVVEVGVAAEANGHLMAAAISTAPAELILTPDTVELDQVNGRPVLRFRFGSDGSLNLMLTPGDLTKLQAA
jgi:hypothetical protein